MTKLALALLIAGIFLVLFGTVVWWTGPILFAAMIAGGYLAITTLGRFM